MRLLFTLLLTLVTSNAYGWTLGTLDELSVDIARFGFNREPMTPDIGPKDYRGRVRVNFDLGLCDDLIKWANEVHTEGTDAKVETVGWRYTVSVPTPWGIHPYYEHHSRHVMDAAQPIIQGRTKSEKFAVEDSYGIRIVFYTRGAK